MKPIHGVTIDFRRGDRYRPKLLIKPWSKAGRWSLLHSASALCWTLVLARITLSASSPLLCKAGCTVAPFQHDSQPAALSSSHLPLDFSVRAIIQGEKKKTIKLRPVSPQLG